MDRKDFYIGILFTTALILFAALVFVDRLPEAQAESMTILHRDYAIAVGALSDNDEDLVYVIDAPTERLNVYRFDSRQNMIDLVQSLSLAEMRAASATAPAQQPGGKKRKP